eukprot:11201917-Lingulodinium_polyedra.AAC.1
MFRGHHGSQIARLRTPCAGRFSLRAWSARACGLRAVATAKRRFDHVIAQRFRRVARRCGRMNVSRSKARQ